MLGAPASGKGTQGAMLAEALRVPHVSIGSLLRRSIDEGDPHGVSRWLDAGDLVPDESSIAFDRAASFYDHTRQLSADTANRITELLRSEIEPRGGCLEIGVGTGRVAIPIVDAGISLVGVDLSLPMLQRLIEKSGG